MRTIAVALVLVLAGPARAEVPPPEAAILKKIGWDQRLDAQVPADLALVGEDGVPTTFGAAAAGRPAVLQLNYNDCPMLCGLVSNGLVRALRDAGLEIGEDFAVLTVSIDPAETPDLAARMGRGYRARLDRPGAERGWRFFVSDTDSIRTLAAVVGFRYAKEAVTGEFAHPAGVVVLTPDGRVSRYLFGIEFAARDLRLALVEAAEGKIGTPVDQILLYCYHYDPQTGRYGLAIRRVLQAAAVATVGGIALAVGGFLAWERRERSDS